MTAAAAQAQREPASLSRIFRRRAAASLSFARGPLSGENGICSLGIFEPEYHEKMKNRKIIPSEIASRF
jgi:hypothetical protein